MTGLYSVILTPLSPQPGRRWLARLCCALTLLAPLVQGADQTIEQQLAGLARQREMLSGELDQFKITVKMIHTEDSPPEQSSNPAVRKLALEMMSLRERLVAVTEQEVTLLQEQIIAARQLSADVEAAQSATPGAGPAAAMESKPLRMSTPDDSMEREEEHVRRLHALLASYYAEMQEAARTLPTDEELAARAAAQLDAERLSRIPFSVDKVRLNGAEGSTALSQITRRLSDPNIPESRRDIAPICGIRTRLFGALIASERRSLRPVGKNHYIARVRLQPGDTTLRIKEHSWEVQLPQNVNAGDYLITLYAPPGVSPELHLFAVDDLLAEQDAHIPAWLPAEINLSPRAG